MAQRTTGQTVFLEAAPYFLVDDVIATAEHYRDKLGFEIGTYFGAPPAFVIVKRNTTRLMLRQPYGATRPIARPNTERFAHALDAYIWVSDIDELGVELKGRGADIIEGPFDSDGDAMRREMLVRDLNGYVLCFGRVLGWPD